MKHPQFTFDLSLPANVSPASFVRGAANDAARQLVADWPKWPGPVVAIIGPEACGKSHLGAIWAEACDALSIPLEDLSKEHLSDGMAHPLWVDRAGEGAPFDETALFHALNMAREEASFILITARQPLAKWKVALPDLASRLKAVPLVEITTPDDTLLDAILIKQCTDLGIEVDDAVRRYVLARAERSYGAIAALSNAFGQRTLAAHRRASVPLASQVLDEILGPE